MKCKLCSHENPDTAKFCSGCGAKLDASQASQETSEQENAKQSEQQQQQNAQSNTQFDEQSQAQQSTQSQTQNQSNATYVAGNAQYGAKSAFQPKSDDIDNSQYTASPFASGWADISHSNGWVGRSVLLGLCSLVPILRWVVYGFATRWGREVCFGVNRRMPQTIFEEGTFSTGAKIWVCNLVYLFIFVFAFFLLMLIPFIGALVFVVALIAFALISPLLDFQIGLSGKISAGFTGIGRAFKLLKKAPLKTLASSMGPAFMVEGFILIVIVAVFLVILFGFSGSYFTTVTNDLLLSQGSAGSDKALASTLQYGVGYLGSNFLLCAFAWFAYTVGEALSNVWCGRALGHLVSREASEWLEIPGFVDLKNTNLQPGEPITPFVPGQKS